MKRRLVVSILLTLLCLSFVFDVGCLFGDPTTIQGSDITLTWTPNSENYLGGYTIYWSTTSGQYDYENPAFIVDINDPADLAEKNFDPQDPKTTITGFSPGTYYFVARAFDTNTKCMKDGVEVDGPCFSLDSNEVAGLFEIAVTIPADVKNIRRQIQVSP